MMLGNQLALVRRELLEHKSIYVVPAVLGALFVLLEITGHVTISAFDKEIDLALLGATNIGINERAAVIAALLSVFSGIFVLSALIVMAFYSLDALYAERKDKSILFWRSLPVTDSETVISKLLTTLVVIPLVTLAFIAITHLLVLITISIWVGMRGADAWHLIWQAAPLMDIWITTTVLVLCLSFWLAPFFGWFLLVSGYTRRAPMLMAILPLLVLPMLEVTILRTHLFGEALLSRSPDNIPLLGNIDSDIYFDADRFRESTAQGFSLFSMLEIDRYLASPGLWIGLAVCGLFVTAAIYVRRYRDESY